MITVAVNTCGLTDHNLAAPPIFGLQNDGRLAGSWLVSYSQLAILNEPTNQQSSTPVASSTASMTGVGPYMNEAPNA
jgi:hypothetical protein